MGCMQNRIGECGAVRHWRLSEPTFTPLLRSLQGASVFSHQGQGCLSGTQRICQGQGCLSGTQRMCQGQGCLSGTQCTCQGQGCLSGTRHMCQGQGCLSGTQRMCQGQGCLSGTQHMCHACQAPRSGPCKTPNRSRVTGYARSLTHNNVKHI